MNATMHVRLPKGVLRSLRLNAIQGPWHELEHARWLRTVPANAANEVVAELLDAALLGQAPARPDRMRAADWALRASSSVTAGAIGPLPRLASVYLAAQTDPETGSGLSELDQMARACGVPLAELPALLDQLAATGLLRSWQACSDSGDLQ
ncbi:hypothetical protein ACWEP4_44810 [Streptomyces sp. NPDC004227]